jgi:DNA-binding MarR family transcriptional regulator
MNGANKEESLTLELLQAIDQRSDVTQRNLADRLDVALGLANSYLKRCVRKGLVKVKQVPPNRYLYYLTPKGFTEKSRLTTEYLRHSFNFYRKASDSMSWIMRRCQAEGRTRLCLAGVSELAEVALIRAREFPVTVTAIFDPDCPAETYLGLPVLRDAGQLAAFDACILTSIAQPAAMLERISGSLEPAKLLVPDLLGLKQDGKQ